MVERAPDGGADTFEGHIAAFAEVPLEGPRRRKIVPRTLAMMALLGRCFIRAPPKLILRLAVLVASFGGPFTASGCSDHSPEVSVDSGLDRPVLCHSGWPKFRSLAVSSAKFYRNCWSDGPAGFKSATMVLLPRASGGTFTNIDYIVTPLTFGH